MSLDSPCLWLREALATDSGAATPPLDEATSADVCIVGGGYVGLWTALRLLDLDPSLDVVIVERDICGGGASGRNAGFVLSWWIKFPKLKRLFGEEEALALARTTAGAVDEIASFCADHDVDPALRREGWLVAASNAAQLSGLHDLLAVASTVDNPPFVELAPGELSRFTSPSHLAGVLEPAGATLQPAVLARGLRRVALQRGVRIYEHSTMRALSRTSPPLVTTGQGSVRADRVVIATNAWAGELRELSRSFVALGADAGATTAIPERLSQLGWNSAVGVNDSRMLINFHRTTDDGRVVFGKGFADPIFRNRVGSCLDGPSRHAHDLRDNFRKLHPQLADVAIETTWSGPIDRTVDNLPFFCGLGGRPDIVCGLGWSGNGIAPSVLGGKILASLVLDLDDEWSGSPLVRQPPTFPPEPLRYPGARLVRRAVRAKERAEDEGRQPSRITLAVASLSPGGLVAEKGGVRQTR